jgi:hypothetical protein
VPNIAASGIVSEYHMRRSFVALAAIFMLTAAFAADDLSDVARSCASRGDWTEAARCFREAAAHYRDKGDEQAALVLDNKADQYEPDLRGYRMREAPAAELRRFYTGQKAEPIYGCYIGVNCFSDPKAGDFETFCNLTGKRHAMFYQYARHCGFDDWLLGMVRPEGPWWQAACEIGQGLSMVQPGPALEAWARRLGRAQGPVFLRWGSEMNGDWVPWHGDPEAYIRKWRLVHDAMARLAPKVAMVWCPNATPIPQIDRYYPGDDYVDWVGVNAYVVSIHDNQPDRNAEHENPADLFKYIYRRYSARKPMMICETGVTHYAAALGRPDYAFAEARIGHLYGCLPRLYPRIKAICYYDVDNTKGTATGRPFNNYLLTDNQRVLAAYKRAIAPDYFLSEAQSPAGDLPHYIEPLASGMTLSGHVHLSAWAKSYEIAPMVEYALDGAVIGTSSAQGAFDCDLDCGMVPAGPHALTLTMRTEAGGRALKQVRYAVNVE